MALPSGQPVSSWYTARSVARVGCHGRMIITAQGETTSADRAVRRVGQGRARRWSRTRGSNARSELSRCWSRRPARGRGSRGSRSAGRGAPGARMGLRWGNGRHLAWWRPPRTTGRIRPDAKGGATPVASTQDPGGRHLTLARPRAGARSVALTVPVGHGRCRAGGQWRGTGSRPLSSSGGRARSRRFAENLPPTRGYGRRTTSLRPSGSVRPMAWGGCG
jgi:hypothetical protein